MVKVQNIDKICASKIPQSPSASCCCINNFFIWVFWARWSVSAKPMDFHKLFVVGLAKTHNYRALNLKGDFRCWQSLDSLSFVYKIKHLYIVLFRCPVILWLAEVSSAIIFVCVIVSKHLQVFWAARRWSCHKPLLSKITDELLSKVAKHVSDLDNQHTNGPHQDQIFYNPSAVCLPLWAKNQIRL